MEKLRLEPSKCCEVIIDMFSEGVVYNEVYNQGDSVSA